MSKGESKKMDMKEHGKSYKMHEMEEYGKLKKKNSKKVVKKKGK